MGDKIPPLQSMVGPLDGAPLACTLDTIDAMSARVRMGPTSRLPEMASVALWLTDEEGASVVIPAFAGWPEPDGEDNVWELYFAQPNALRDHQQNASDRRSAVRVSPAADQVEVWLHTERPGEDEPVECVLVDVGEGGMCVELTIGLEPTTPFTRATFQLLLPGEAWPLILEAQVRYRARISRELVRYGVEFDAMRTIEFHEQQKLLAGFVNDRVEGMASRVEEQFGAVIA